MRVLGIDPGLNGGIAVIEETRVWAAIDIPTHGTKSKRRVDAGLVIRFIKQWNPGHAFIERAQAMPQQGSSSGFNYGRAVGALEAAVIAAGVPMSDPVDPGVWKRRMGLRGGTASNKAALQAKEAARQRALMLFPQSGQFFERKMDHGRAEAALIAYYGARYVLAGRPRIRRDV